jgi:hypothetical protein
LPRLGAGRLTQIKSNCGELANSKAEDAWRTVVLNCREVICSAGFDAEAAVLAHRSNAPE